MTRLSDLMTTREVADYLRIKERKVYDLVSQRRIPCTRATGKWLFPKELIDLWLLDAVEGWPTTTPHVPPPTIVTGSHDPLLDWAIRESGCGLAILFDGSLDGLERFRAQQALACGIHIFDPDSGQYNTPFVRQHLSTAPIVAIEWCQREQGLIVAAGNPLNITAIGDLNGRRCALRQTQAGSRILFDYLVAKSGIESFDLQSSGPPLRSETEMAQAIASGEADAGIGIAAVATAAQLDFIPLTKERFDLVIWRRQYFEEPMQTLFAFCRSERFSARAKTMAGYDIGALGTVQFLGS